MGIFLPNPNIFSQTFLKNRPVAGTSKIIEALHVYQTDVLLLFVGHVQLICAFTGDYGIIEDMNQRHRQDLANTVHVHDLSRGLSSLTRKSG